MSLTSDHWETAERMLSLGFFDEPRQRFEPEYVPSVTMQPLYDHPTQTDYSRYEGEPYYPQVTPTPQPDVKPEPLEPKPALVEKPKSTPVMGRCTLCGKNMSRHVCLGCKAQACAACFTTFLGLCHKCYHM